MKYIAAVRENFAGQPVFSGRSLFLFLSKKGISRAYAKHLVHNLLKKKELLRVAKGFYSFQRDPAVSGFAFSPFYYGLQEALSLRNLWEQETNPVIITPKKVRPGLRRSMGANIVVHRIGRKMFFGFSMVKYYDFWLPVSDPEKTLIDFAYFKEQLPEEALCEIKKTIDKKKLRQYLKKTPFLTRKKVEKMLE
jgi:predicted transcriptional regulator of viral defense system